MLQHVLHNESDAVGHYACAKHQFSLLQRTGICASRDNAYTCNLRTNNDDLYIPSSFYYKPYEISFSQSFFRGTFSFGYAAATVTR